MGYASELADYITSIIESDGSFTRVGEPDFLLDSRTEATVEVAFGPSERVVRFKAVRRPAFGGRLLVLIEQRRSTVVDERVSGDDRDSERELGLILSYEYDMFDEEYGFELGCHSPTENEEPGGPHRHLRRAAGRRVREPHPRVALEEALADFVDAMWSNRFEEI
jgi:hypothetical protein